VGGEGPRLFEEAVDEGGFTVIDVSDDRNIANRAGGGHEGIGRAAAS
jgi:hypothetical protein